MPPFSRFPAGIRGTLPSALPAPPPCLKLRTPPISRFACSAAGCRPAGAKELRPGLVLVPRNCTRRRSRRWGQTTLARCRIRRPITAGTLTGAVQPGLYFRGLLQLGLIRFKVINLRLYHRVLPGTESRSTKLHPVPAAALGSDHAMSTLLESVKSCTMIAP